MMTGNTRDVIGESFNMKWSQLWCMFLSFLGRSFGDSGHAGEAEGSHGLFGCSSLANAHYNYMRHPGDSVDLRCPKTCREEGSLQWYHSFVKTTGRDLRLLEWNGTSHEAAITAVPSQWSVGYFCCGCEEDEDPAESSCCWGVAYQPTVKFTITRRADQSEAAIVPVGTELGLRCEAKGFPQVGLKLAVPEGFNRSLAECSETEKSWYSTVYTCHFLSSEEASGQFSCTGSIVVDSQDGKEVEHNTTVPLELTVYRKPTIVYLYQSSELGSRLNLLCVVDCSPVLTCSVLWLYNGYPVDLTNPMYEASSNRSVHNLSVLQPGEGQVGAYTCVLSSHFEVDEDNKTVQLVLPDGVQPSPLGELPGPVEEVSLHPQRKYLLIGSFVLILCSALIVISFLIYLMIRLLPRRWLPKDDSVAPLVKTSDSWEDVAFRDGPSSSLRSRATKTKK